MKIIYNINIRMKNMKTRKVSIKINSNYDFEIYDVIITTQGRSNFQEQRFCEEGEWFTVTTWTRDDGKIDSYRSVFIEAQQNGLNT